MNLAKTYGAVSSSANVPNTFEKFPSDGRKFLAICGKNADNKFRYTGGCKGRVFLASEKFNPVRECGPGFRKNLLYLEKKV